MLPTWPSACWHLPYSSLCCWVLPLYPFCQGKQETQGEARLTNLGLVRGGFYRPPPQIGAALQSPGWFSSIPASPKRGSGITVGQAPFPISSMNVPLQGSWYAFFYLRKTQTLLFHAGGPGEIDGIQTLWLTPCESDPHLKLVEINQYQYLPTRSSVIQGFLAFHWDFSNPDHILHFASLQYFCVVSLWSTATLLNQELAQVPR